jgi:hypothetical protein
VPNIFRDWITLNAKGYPDVSNWSDMDDLVNNKAVWESLVIVSSSLLSGTKDDNMGNPYLRQQKMAVVETNVDSVYVWMWSCLYLCTRVHVCTYSMYVRGAWRLCSNTVRAY